MKNCFPLSLLLLIIALSSCKTQEEIAREQEMTNISMQMVQGQKLTAEATTRLQSMDERINNLQGVIEVQGHEQSQTSNQKIQGLERKVKVLEESNADIKQKLGSIQQTLVEQKSYLDQVIKTLSDLGSGKKAVRSNSKKKSSPYSFAMNTYRQGKYNDAKQLLLPLLNDKSINQDQKANILHNLGMIEYINKNDNQALVYFSKLYTQYPTTTYNKNGLLFLGRTFRRLGKKEEAKQILEELIKNFPKARQAKDAKKIIEELK